MVSASQAGHRAVLIANPAITQAKTALFSVASSLMSKMKYVMSTTTIGMMLRAP